MATKTILKSNIYLHKPFNCLITTPIFVLQSTVIQDANKNPNFAQNVKFLDVELPEQEMYCPPLSIRVVDCRSFGRFTLVGNHTSPSIHKYLYHPVTKGI